MRTLRTRWGWMACAIVASLAAAAPAIAGDVSALRVMLHPYAAAPGELPGAARVTLEALAGTSLTLTGTTRTGALELALAAPVPEADAKAMVKALRVDRSVLWAETITTSIARKSAPNPRGDEPGRRLIVRLKDNAAADWPAITARLAKTLGMEVTVDRQIANVWVLTVPLAQSAESLAKLAEIVQQDPAIQYADPVRRAYPHAAPNDPYYRAQWSLRDEVAGINIETAWALQPSANNVTVAVVDTGILPHPDLVGRVLPGYDFISDPNRARDGNARDPDPRDEGDWSAGECGADYDSFFHGLFVAGLVAANTDNGIGIAGVAGGVRILPVRVLGACGGTFEDVFEGMLWASGVPIKGVPLNKNPAKVINLSLGGYGPCDQSLQEAVNDALAQGAVVVVSAGNEGLDVADFAPGNCSGVITVGAHNVQGGPTGYTNWGSRVVLTAPGGERPVPDLMLSLSNDGRTVPAEPSYISAAGTSFSAPLVSGTAALMFGRDPLLTGGRVLDTIAGTTRLFPGGSQCNDSANLCGSGMLDAGTAVGSILPGGPQPPNTSRVVEFYRADLDHYFITADPAEVHFIETFLGGIFQRTGLYFYAYLSRAVAPPSARPVCRFYADADVQINSHWYSANEQECIFVLLNWPGIWNLERADAFFIEVPDADGRCPAKTLPVYRFFNNRRDANHRYTVDLSTRRAMTNRAWSPEGYGQDAVAFCSAI